MKNKATLIVVTLLLSFAFEVIAQQPPNFEAVEAAGIYTIDIDHAVKKLKTEDPKIDQSIRKFLGEYNMEIYRLSDEHAEALTELDEMFDRQLQIAMQRRDRSQMDGVKVEIKKTIPPIRRQVMQYESELNAELQSVLSEKQFDKWLRYQKNQQPPVPQFGN